MPDRIRDRTRGACDPDFTHALDTEGIHVRVALLDKDRFERWHIGIHGNVVLGQIGIHRTPGPWIDRRVLLQRKRHAPYHAAAELAVHHARIDNAARSKGANNAGDAHLSEIRIDLDLGEHGPMRVHGVIRLRGLICCALALSLYLRKAARPLLGKLAGLRSELTATALEGINPADAHRLLAQLDLIKENVRNAIQHPANQPPRKEQRYG